MNILKKKLGAGLLSLAMLAGGGVHITSAADDFFVHSSTATSNQNGDSSNSTPATSVKSVQGYRTQAPVGYAVNVTWGNMVFDYNEGTFNTTSGRYEVLNSGVARTDVELDATAGAANKWYGIDGTNNKVTVENISTQGISISVAVNSDGKLTGARAGNATGSFYREVASDAPGSTVTPAGHSAANGKKFISLAESTGSVSLAKADRNADGVVTNKPKDAIYLSLTGAPDTLLGSTAESIGAITLTFTPAPTV